MAVVLRNTLLDGSRILDSVTFVQTVLVTQELIDKLEGFEIVRDQVAAILAADSASQMSIAEVQGKDPELWRLRVYTERSNPWERWLNSPDLEDTAPIVNVWWEDSSFDENASSVVGAEQQAEATINIDIYGHGVASDNPTGGHFAGDEDAARNMQRGVRLVRNIIMASHNTYLQLRGVVGKRWPRSITSFQPQLADPSAIQVIAARIALTVRVVESTPQWPPTDLEQVNIVLNRETGGEWLTALYDFTN